MGPILVAQMFRVKVLDHPVATARAYRMQSRAISGKPGRLPIILITGIQRFTSKYFKKLYAVKPRRTAVIL